MDGTDCCGAQPDIGVLLTDATIARAKSVDVVSIAKQADQYRKDWYFSENNHCMSRYFGFSDTYAAALWMVD